MNWLVTISSSYIERGKRKHPLEADEQKASWEWLGLVKLDGGKTLQDFSYMVPNGTQLGGSRTRRAQYMASLKAQGFKNGVSDLVIAYPVGKYHGAYIEMKRVRKAFATPSALAAAASKDQKEWLRLMASVGYWVYVAYGFDDFRQAVRGYLQKKNQPPLDFDL